MIPAFPTRTKQEPRMVVKATQMKRGELSRWGRGICEGYSLEIGEALRGSEVRSSTVGLPTNNVTPKLHNRMPVILAESDWPKWLGEVPESEQELPALLGPCPDDALKIWPVAKAVGNVRNNGPQLMIAI